MPRSYVYVSHFGAIWKLSRRSYRKFLKAAAAGEEWSLNDYGKTVLFDYEEVTDLTPEEAAELLERLNDR